MPDRTINLGGIPAVEELENAIKNFIILTLGTLPNKEESWFNVEGWIISITRGAIWGLEQDHRIELEDMGGTSHNKRYDDKEKYDIPPPKNSYEIVIRLTGKDV